MAGARQAVGAVALLAALSPAGAAAEDWAAVAAILEARCVFCHEGEYAPLGLALDSHAGLMAGSENGPVVVPAEPGASVLLDRLTGRAEPSMPLDGPPFLEEAEIALVEVWIAAGAPGPEEPEEQEQAPEPPDPYADGVILYGEVARVFGRHCIECHSDNGRHDVPPEGLRLDSRASILAGGDRTVLIPGNPQASEIVRRIEGLAVPRMPFDGPPWLSEAESRLLRDWIAGGARDDDGEAAPVPAGGRVRFRGVLTGAHEIDGAGFTVTGETRIDDPPRVGGRAEMRGRVAPDGSIVADRLRER